MEGKIKAAEVGAAAANTKPYYINESIARVTDDVLIHSACVNALRSIAEARRGSRHNLSPWLSDALNEAMIRLSDAAFLAEPGVHHDG